VILSTALGGICPTMCASRDCIPWSSRQNSDQEGHRNHRAVGYPVTSVPRLMYLRPVGQCAITVPERVAEVGRIPEQLSTELPRVNSYALLDGLPLDRHRCLDQRLILDDLKDTKPNYQARERIHVPPWRRSFVMVNLDETGTPISTKVYVRPILQPHRGFDIRLWSRSARKFAH